MKQTIFLIDIGNAEFLIENDDKYKLPTLENYKEIKNISDDFFKKYDIKIKEHSIEILKNTDNYILIKAHADKFTKNEKYECKILKEAYEMIDEPIHKSLLLDINNNILFETINDSFWLGVILTVEDNLEDYQMKNILSAFLLHFSSIFCQEVVKYKLGKIINPELSNNSNLKKMRNSYLKDTPLYDSKKIKKVIEEMGINFDKDGIFDIVLYMLDNELIDINSRNWNFNKINNYEMYNGIICSPRRWIKNQLTEEINNGFEKLRKEIVEQIIKKFSEIKIIPKSYSTKRLFNTGLSYNEKVYILQRIGLIKTIKLIYEIFGKENFSIEKDDTGFYIDFNVFFIKVKATLIEMIWNDNKNNDIPFLREILSELPKELDESFFIINRKCRDNIHYGFYNNLEKEEYLILDKNQNIYINYIIEELNKKITYVFDKKYCLEIKIANFLYKIFNKN